MVNFKLASFEYLKVNLANSFSRHKSDRKRSPSSASSPSSSSTERKKRKKEKKRKKDKKSKKSKKKRSESESSGGFSTNTRVFFDI